MIIYPYIEEKNILFFEEKHRDRALLRLVESLYKTKKIEDAGQFFQAILEREKVVSTGIGMGIAIPHAKMQTYQDFFIAIGIQKTKGIEWNSLDKSLVRLIFMIGGPDNRQTDYLKILSKLTSIIRNEVLREKIMGAISKDDVLQIFKEY